MFYYFYFDFAPIICHFLFSPFLSLSLCLFPKFCLRCSSTSTSFYFVIIYFLNASFSSMSHHVIKCVFLLFTNPSTPFFLPFSIYLSPLLLFSLTFVVVVVLSFFCFFNLLCASLLYSIPSPYLNELIRSLSISFKHQDKLSFCISFDCEFKRKGLLFFYYVIIDSFL